MSTSPVVPDGPVSEPVSVTTDHRRAPRKRGEALLDAIYAAVYDELTAVGWSGMRMDSVAQRAHVSKASLYRRWPSRTELVADAILARLPDAGRLPDTGSLRDDLCEVFRAVAATLHGPAGAGLRGLLGAALSDPETAGDLRHVTRGRGISLIREVVLRAESRGELDSRLITVRQLETGHAMLRHHFLINGKIDDAYLVEVVDEVMVPLLRAVGRPAPQTAVNHG